MENRGVISVTVGIILAVLVVVGAVTYVVTDGGDFHYQDLSFGYISQLTSDAGVGNGFIYSGYVGGFICDGEIILEDCSNDELYSMIDDDCDILIDDVIIYGGALNPEEIIDDCSSNQEICDGIDNNCDGFVDEFCENVTTYSCDEDGDGDYSAEISGTCSPPIRDYWFCNIAAFISQWDMCKCENMECGPNGGNPYTGLDCDDSNPDINYMAQEICDGIDNNCDGFVDGDRICDKVDYYCDEDLDGFVSNSISGSCFEVNCELTACEGNAGQLISGTDCDDLNSNTYPNATEICDGSDNNCDGSTRDERRACFTLNYYCDEDLDGEISNNISGSCISRLFDCLPSECSKIAGMDCDDTNLAVNSIAIEVCDDIDNNCNGLIDEGDVCGGSSFPDDYISWWKFDGNANDETENNDGTLNGGAIFVADTSSDDRGQVLSLDGSGYVNAGNFDVQGTGITLSAWIYSNNYDSESRIIDKSTGSAEADHYWMMGPYSSSGMDMRFRLKTSGTTSTFIAGNADLINGQWTHIAVSYDGTNKIFYKNSAEINRESDSGSISTSSSVPVYIGKNTDGYYFNGLLDNVMVYERGLTAGEIEQVYNSQLNQCETDIDGDGYGFGASCLGSDCDDDNEWINPGSSQPNCNCIGSPASETCDGLDNDCNGLMDDGACPTINYSCDGDIDGFLSSSFSGSCNIFNCLPSECSETIGDDCDDSNNIVYPGAGEICDGVANDCNDLSNVDLILDVACSGSKVCLDGQCCEDSDSDGNCDSDCMSYVSTTTELNNKIVSASAGEIVCINPGNYGVISFTSSSAKGNSNSWITYQATDPNNKPILDQLQFSGSQESFYLKFDGIHIGPHEECPIITIKPDGKCSTTESNWIALLVSGVNNIIFSNMYLEGYDADAWVGFKAVLSENIVLDNSTIHKFSYPAEMESGSSNITIKNTEIYELSRSGIRALPGFLGGTFENNYLHNSHSGQGACNQCDPHGGSGFSIRVGNLVIKDNIVHDGFSQGLYFYPYTQYGPYTNINITGNLFYDGQAGQLFKCEMIEGPVYITHNTIIGYAGGFSGEKLYYGGDQFGASALAGYSSDNVHIENNVVVGLSGFGQAVADTGNVKNNIFYSWTIGSSIYPLSLANNLIIQPNYQYFLGAGNFFTGGSDPSFWEQYSYVGDVTHGQNLNDGYYPEIDSDACPGGASNQLNLQEGEYVGAFPCEEPSPSLSTFVIIIDWFKNIFS